MRQTTLRPFLMTLAILSLGALAAMPAAAQGENQALNEGWQPRFRVGAYFEGYAIKDKNLKDFYKHSQINLPGFEASVHTAYNIDVWASYRIYKDEAKTTFFEMLSKFRINAASVGALYRPLRWKILEPFVGAGLNFYSYKETLEGGSDVEGASGNAIGFHIQAGTYVDILNKGKLRLSGKAFYRFNAVKKTLAVALPDESNSLDLGGHEFGAGLSIGF